MKPATLAFLVIFTTLTLATPTLFRRDDGVSCVGNLQDDNTDINWNVVVNNDSRYDTGGCGAGFLDNFRGRCGVITSWGCNIGDNDSANMNFDTTIGCTAYDITQAINAATGGAVNLNCQCNGGCS